MQALDCEEASPPTSLTAPSGSERCAAYPVSTKTNVFWLSRSGLPATEAAASKWGKEKETSHLWNHVRSDDLKVRPTECSGKNGKRLFCLPANFFFEKKHWTKKKKKLWHVVSHGGNPQMLPKVGNGPGQFLGSKVMNRVFTTRLVQW